MRAVATVHCEGRQNPRRRSSSATARAVRQTTDRHLDRHERRDAADLIDLERTLPNGMSSRAASRAASRRRRRRIRAGPAPIARNRTSAPPPAASVRSRSDSTLAAARRRLQLRHQLADLFDDADALNLLPGLIVSVWAGVRLPNLPTAVSLASGNVDCTIVRPFGMRALP